MTAPLLGLAVWALARGAQAPVVPASPTDAGTFEQSAERGDGGYPCSPSTGPEIFQTDSERHALQQVLTAAKEMLGAPYRTRPAHIGSDALKKDAARVGIDCSHAIWLAFSEAGLSYEYVPTSAMANSNSSVMTKSFVRCTGESFNTGDVLVYRDDVHDVGHTVLVLSPEGRLAWGAQSLDGDLARDGRQPRSGVCILPNLSDAGWERWDRPDLVLKACWRNKAFLPNKIPPPTDAGLPHLGAGT